MQLLNIPSKSVHFQRFLYSSVRSQVAAENFIIPKWYQNGFQKIGPRSTSGSTLIAKRYKSGYESVPKVFKSSNPRFTPRGSITLAIRREDASIWERRAPLGPSHVRKLTRRGIRVLVQPSNRRAYPLQAYVNAGAVIQEDISSASVIIGVKQVPIDSLIPDKTYCFFSHTIKAQEDNMPLLDAILERNIRLIDYEKMVNANNERVVAFGKYAGIAGIINILHGLGLRLLALGHHTPFMHIGPAHNYRNSGMARQAVRDCGYEIALGMMPRSIGPLTFVFTGSGNVSQGAQEIFQELPYEYVEPKDLPQVSQFGSTNKVYASVVRRDDHIMRKSDGNFDPIEYQEFPERYISTFATTIAPFASVIINGLYWDVNSPRLLTIPDAKRLLKETSSPWLPTSHGAPALPHRLLAICDISADPGGSIEFNTSCTTIDTPFCLYDAESHTTSDGTFSGKGVLVCSIDNMPTQIPLEATDAFGHMLYPYMDDILSMDAREPIDKIMAYQSADSRTGDSESADTLSNQSADSTSRTADSGLDPVVAGAVIASNGKLTPAFQYITDLRRKRMAEKSRQVSKMSSCGRGSRSVLVLGAGYVSRPLVEYLTRDPSVSVTVASALQGQGQSLVQSSHHENASSLVLDVNAHDPESASSKQLNKLISDSDLVVSILPYNLHPLIASKCIKYRKNMVTASYTSPEMRELHADAIESGICILNEVGLDPGIDHLLAMESFDQVTSNGGKIKSFVSWCGGLPAPEAADNPLRYKFSWNPRGVLLNSVSGATWLERGEVKIIPEGGAIMDFCNGHLDLNSEFSRVNFLNGFNLEAFPNRNSLIYKDLYQLDGAETVLRGTLRYSGFCSSIRGLIDLGFMSADPVPFLHSSGPEITWKQLICRLLDQENESMLASNLRHVLFDRLSNFSNSNFSNTSDSEIRHRVKVIEELGLLSDQVLVEKCGTPIDTITKYLNGKLSFEENERDVIIMRHEIGIEWPVTGGKGRTESRTISLVVYGDSGYSAMSRCVGYPTAIAAKMILDGEIQEKGVVIPLKPEIYHPIIQRLKNEGIVARETSSETGDTYGHFSDTEMSDL